MSGEEKSTADVIIGKVGRPHGVRGELRVFTESEESRTLAQIPEVILTLSDGSRRVFKVRRAREAQRFWILSLEGVNDRSAAEALVGADCAVPRDALPPLDDDDEFYLVDLIGLDVVDAGSGASLGRALEVFDNGAHDVLVYGTSMSRAEMVPLIESFVEEIDLDAGLIRISPMEME